MGGAVEDETRARVGALGISIDASFRCVLPGHDHEASLHWARRYWRYRCPSHSFGLAEVRAAVAYGEVRKLSPPEMQRWRERIDYEAGLLVPVGVLVEVPDECGPSARRVSRGISLYLGLRVRRGGFGPDEPFTFARRFCMAWCGLSNDQARDGMRELNDRCVIERTGEKKRAAIVWRLAPRAPGLSFEVAAPAVERLERSLPPDPSIPSDDEALVDGAQARAGTDVGMRAVGHAAMRSVGHAADDNRPLGGQPALTGDTAPDESDPPWLDEFRRLGRGAWGVTLSAGTLEAIGRAAHRAGGDLADAEDLVRVWGRLERDWQPRVERMRHEARTVRCRCGDSGGELSRDDRCQRCYGRRGP